MAKIKSIYKVGDIVGLRPAMQYIGAPQYLPLGALPEEDNAVGTVLKVNEAQEGDPHYLTKVVVSWHDADRYDSWTTEHWESDLV